LILLCCFWRYRHRVGVALIFNFILMN
jgi:hypothetical protein